MSLFDDFLHAIGHTIDSLAQDVGADAGLLESIVNDLDGNGIHVLSAAAKLGLSPVGFLRGIVDCMHGDPHQCLLSYVTVAVKHMDAPLYLLPQQWSQMAKLHQETAQTIDTHMTELFQSNGAYSYSGPAADVLWTTHQNYQQYFTVLVEHTQTQQVRYAQLNGSVNDYLSQMPHQVYSLSTPMAALGVLSLNSVATAPGVLDDPAVQTVEQWLAGAFQTGEQLNENDPDPEPGSHAAILLFLAIVIIVLAIVFVAVFVFITIKDAFECFLNAQKSTTLKSPSTLVPLNSLTPDQQRLLEDVKSRLGYGPYSDADIEALIRAGYLDPDVIAAIMKSGNFAAFDDLGVANMMNVLPPSVQLLIVSQAIANNDSQEQVAFILSCITKTKSLMASEGVRFTNTGGETSTGHTLQKHVGIPDADLEARVSKGKTAGGAQFATTFTDEATAQEGVDMVIAKSSKLQQLIKAAVPGTQATDKQCLDTANYGHGFKKNVIGVDKHKQAIYGPPTRYDNLHCVVVTIGIGPDGVPLITTAYPSL
ncbi:MAG: RNase A-like domain-containing protein [Ktedonobacteraceae bacterium]